MLPEGVTNVFIEDNPSISIGGISLGNGNTGSVRIALLGRYERVFLQEVLSTELVASGTFYSIDFGEPVFLRSGTITLATAAVPEPATWAMMIGGFGLVGGAMRRVNGTAAAA